VNRSLARRLSSTAEKTRWRGNDDKPPGPASTAGETPTSRFAVGYARIGYIFRKRGEAPGVSIVPPA